MILARHLSYVESFIYYFGAALFGVQELVSLWKAEVLSKEDGARVGFGVDPSLPPDHGLDPSLPPDQDLVASVENKSQVLFTVADPMNMLGVEEDNYFEGNAEELSPSSRPGNLTMANIMDTQKLHLLADVALWLGPQETQRQPALTTPRNHFSHHDDDQPAHAQPPQGFTYSNAAVAAGASALNIPHPPPSHSNTTVAPPQAVTKKKKRKSHPRTTGFDKGTGENMYTLVCGMVTPSKGTPLANPSRRNGNFRCPRCRGRFTRPRSVKDHFIGCVGKYGNPDGLTWFDDPSLNRTRGWHEGQMRKVEDDEEEDLEEEEEEMEEDEVKGEEEDEMEEEEDEMEEIAEEMQEEEEEEEMEEIEEQWEDKEMEK